MKTSTSRNSVLVSLALALFPAALSSLTACEDGVDGAQGPAGPPGSAGPVGSTGATGATGATGPKGEQGDPGQDGQDGTDGNGGSGGTDGGHHDPDNPDWTLYSADLFSGEGVKNGYNNLSWSTIRSQFANWKDGSTGSRKFYSLSSGSPPSWDETFTNKQGLYVLHQPNGGDCGANLFISAYNGSLWGQVKAMALADGGTVYDFSAIANIQLIWDEDDRCPSTIVFIAQQRLEVGSPPAQAYIFTPPGQEQKKQKLSLTERFTTFDIALHPLHNTPSFKAWINPAQKTDLP